MQVSLKDQDAMIGELRRNGSDKPIAEQMAQLNSLIGQRDKQLKVSALILYSLNVLPVFKVLTLMLLL